jgi:hypothetical protein
MGILWLCFKSLVFTKISTEMNVSSTSIASSVAHLSSIVTMSQLTIHPSTVPSSETLSITEPASASLSNAFIITATTAESSVSTHSSSFLSAVQTLSQAPVVTSVSNSSSSLLSNAQNNSSSSAIFVVFAIIGGILAFSLIYYLLSLIFYASKQEEPKKDYVNSLQTLKRKKTNLLSDPEKQEEGISDASQEELPSSGTIVAVKPSFFRFKRSPRIPSKLRYEMK